MGTMGMGDHLPHCLLQGGETHIYLHSTKQRARGCVPDAEQCRVVLGWDVPPFTLQRVRQEILRFDEEGRGR